MSTARLSDRRGLEASLLDLFIAMIAVAVEGCSAVSSPQPSAARLDIPPSFRNEVEIHHFKKGQKVIDRGFLEMAALASMTRYEGYCGSSSQYDVLGHSSWWLDIYAAGSPRVVDAYAKAKDGYEANLDEWSDFLSSIEQTGPVQPLSYLFARFERKHFVWGDAVSFLSQGTQDTGIYVPCNDQYLTYEVWGVTKDARHTVVMHTVVRNRRLGECRDVRTMEALKSDPVYKFVENCSANEFVPSLADVDKLVNSLQLE